MNKEEILAIANEAYPKIVKYFKKGKQSIPTIKVYRNVYRRFIRFYQKLLKLRL